MIIYSVHTMYCRQKLDTDGRKFVHCKLLLIKHTFTFKNYIFSFLNGLNIQELEKKYKMYTL